MNYLTLTLDEKQLRPMQTVSGEVAWQLAEAPKMLTLRLFWYTRGRGSDDLRVVEYRELPLTTQGKSRFSVALPAGLYSFSGRLITLTWGVEVITDDNQVFASEDIIVSPNGEEVRLDASIQ